jgi:hypothetical protein
MDKKKVASRDQKKTSEGPKSQYHLYKIPKPHSTRILKMSGKGK